MAGLLSHVLGKVPAPGDKIDLEGYRFEVLEANQRKVLLRSRARAALRRCRLQSGKTIEVRVWRKKKWERRRRWLRAGFVAIIGRPNAGKSTLLNRFVGQKVAIVTSKPQTTRNRIQGIVTRPKGQIVFIDTPGLHEANSALNRQMMREVAAALEGIDVLLHDGGRQPHAAARGYSAARKGQAVRRQDNSGAEQS